jgi:hypothetical protein
MNPGTNTFGQPLGRALPGWQPPPRTGRSVLEGRFCRVEPLDVAFRAWLDPVSFAADGRQRVSVAGIRASQRSSD